MIGRPLGWHIRAVVLAAVLATGGAGLTTVAPEPPTASAPSGSTPAGPAAPSEPAAPFAAGAPADVPPAGGSPAAPAAAGSPAAGPAGHDHAAHDHAAHDHAAHDHAAHDHAAHDHAAGGCPAHALLPPVEPGAPRACAHADAPPPGVDVQAPVTTAVLAAREGATPAAAAAAADAGVPTPALRAATTNRVRCDGDGVTGDRVQAIYAVPEGRTNRYAQVVDQIRQWSAGVDSVFNRSAAKTGGVRDVRWVTRTEADGTCSPEVLNVTLPATALGRDFGATVAALHARGFTDRSRKYLVWSDTSALCGIAETYLDSRPGQDNPNNGRYPQIGRVDTGCWGFGQSVEAHELSHLLGSVQSDAPNATRYGHCTDESDRLCYDDSGSEVMRGVCAADQEVLFDCRGDDYYSTNPPTGSYLATHWNTAASRFLLSGSATPTGLGGVLTVDAPAVAGLPTPLTMAVDLPAGRTSSTTWSTSRADCVLSAPRAERTTLSCDTGSTSDAPVTAVTVDSAGERIERQAVVSFATATRWARARMRVGTAAGSPYTTCAAGKAVLTAAVVDKATGLPVQGATVRWVRTAGTAAPVEVARARTAHDGTATSAPVTMVAGSVRVVTGASSTFPSVASGSVTVAVASSPCATTLVGAADATGTAAGEPVTLTGRLTRVDASGATVPVVGETLAVRHRAPGASSTTKIGATPATAADGSFRVVVRPVTSGAVHVALPARRGYLAQSAAPTDLVVRTWTTAITAASSHTELDAGTAVRVSGSLTQTDGGTTSPAAGRPVTVTYPVGDGRTATASTTADAAGAWAVSVRPVVSGSLTAASAGTPGWTGSAAAPLPVTVREQTTAVTLAASAVDTMAGVPVVLSGTATQTGYAGTSPLPGATVVLTFPAPGGGSTTVTAVTDTAGTWRRTVKPLVSGPVTARFPGRPGWAASSAPSSAFTVRTWGTAVSVRSSATTVARGGAVTVSGTVTARDSSGADRPYASARLVVRYRETATRTASVAVRSSASGTWSVTLRPGASGSVVAAFAATPYREGARASVLVSVR